MMLTLLVAVLAIGCSSAPEAPAATAFPVVRQIFPVGNDIGQFLELSGGSARESNSPTPLVTRHNGFEVRCYSYQGVRLAPGTW
jgi:hypothetical protein